MEKSKMLQTTNQMGIDSWFLNSNFKFGLMEDISNCLPGIVNVNPGFQNQGFWKGGEVPILVLIYQSSASYPPIKQPRGFPSSGVAPVSGFPVGWL